MTIATLDALEVLDPGDVIVATDAETRIVIVWNGSQTFNVYAVDENGWWQNVDVFTAYPGADAAPPIMPQYDAVIDEARAHADEYLARAKER